MVPSTALQVSAVVLYSLAFVGSLAGNSLVLYINFKKPNTRTSISFLFVNIAMADLVLTFVVMPASAAFYFRDSKWIEGDAGEITCRLYQFSYTSAIAVSIISLAVATFDRFVAVAYPLRRSRCCGPKVCILVIWSSAGALMLPMLLIFSARSGVCSSDWWLLRIDTAIGNRVLLSILLVLLYILPLLFICVLHSVIFYKLRWHETPGCTMEESVRRAHRQSQKVAKLLLIVLVVFASCWFPVHAFHMFVWAYPIQDTAPPYYVMFLCFWCGHVHSTINPWMYTFLNSNYKSAFRQIFGRCSRQVVPLNRPQQQRHDVDTPL